MSYYKFNDEDIIHNTIKTHPESNFYFFRDNFGRARLNFNNKKNPIVEGPIKDSYNLPGEENDEYHPPNISHVPHGFIELFGQNVARPFDTNENEPDMIIPFITKDSGLTSMSTVSTSQFNSDFTYGDIIEGPGVRGATISTQLISKGVSALDPNGRLRDALKSTFGYYTRLSKRFIYDKGLVGLDASSDSWEQETFRMIQIPSIFYGERIKKGTIKLDWYDKDDLLGTLEDVKQNGELTVTYSRNPAEVGKFVGLAFYSEGFLILTNKSKIYTNNSTTIVDSDGADVGWLSFMQDLKNYKTKDDPRDDSDSTIEVGDASSYPAWSVDVSAPSGFEILRGAPWEPVAGVAHVDPTVVVMTGFDPMPKTTGVLDFGFDDGAHEYVYWTPMNEDLVLGGVNERFYVLSIKTDDDSYFEPTAAAKAAAAEFFNGPNPATEIMESRAMSFNLYFKGTHTIPTMTMLAKMEKTEGSHSNNPTFLDSEYTFEPLSPMRDPNTTELEPLLEGGNGTLVLYLDKDHELTNLSGEFFEAKIANVTFQEADPFAGLNLAFKTQDSNQVLEIYRVLSDGSYEPITGEVIPSGTHQGHSGYLLSASSVFSVRKHCYQKYKPIKGSFGYIENNGFKIKNTVKSRYNDPLAEYEDHTYISKVALYDEDRNLIGIAKMATPVKKTPQRDFVFKMKIDL